MGTIEKNTRVWEIDALRGLLILCMLAWHLLAMVEAFCINGHYHIDSYKWIEVTDPLRCWFYWDEDGVIYQRKWIEILGYCVKPGDATFYIIAGISCQFTRDNMKAFSRLFVAGASLTLYTYVLYMWTGISYLYVRFSVLLSLSVCHLIYEGVFKKKSSTFTLIFAGIFLLVGYYLFAHPISTNSALLHPFGIQQARNGGEYFPICPYFGWFLIGVEIGKKWYFKKATILPKATKIERISRPLQWVGKYSGIIYVAHVVLYRTGFPLAGYAFNIM